MHENRNSPIVSFYHVGNEIERRGNQTIHSDFNED